MGKKDVYILMFKDEEVLSFSVDFRKSSVTFLRKLEHFDKAPYEISGDDHEIQTKLNYFFHHQRIPEFRHGYREILKATHAKNGFNLSFMGHGLSLTNHYWHKKKGENLRYADINFFTNKWDDSFGRALLREDYEAMATADLNVPDIVTPGWGRKGWIYDEEKGPRLYKLGLHEGNSEEALGEVLASRLAQRIFGEGQAVVYDLETVEGRYASVCSPMIAVNEELIPLSALMMGDLFGLYHAGRTDKLRRKEFFEKLKTSEYAFLYSFFVKLACLRTLCFVNDLHFGNISLIRNTDTGEVRVAPVYDLGGSFGSSATAKSLLSNFDRSTLLIIYFMYNILEPEWDYSWYDKGKLVGFEDEIRNVLSKSDFYTPELIDAIITVYQQQKAVLDEISA